MLNEDSRWRGRPPEVWTLALINLFGALICLLGAVRTPAAGTPTGVLWLGAGLGGSFTIALAIAGPRTPAWFRHLDLAGVVAYTTLLVSEGVVPEASMSAAFAFVVTGLYAAMFLPRHQARIYAAASVVGMLAGLHANDVVAQANRSWVPGALAVIGASEALAALHSRILMLTVTDSLTGALNRTGFAQAVEQERLRARRSCEPLALVVIDIDRFKEVNDRFGHSIGDDVLRDLVAEWRAGLRPGDHLARRGGDEFAFLLPATTAAVAAAIAGRLQRASRATWSCGVALVGDDLDEALHEADRAMYAQKAAREAPPTSVA